MGNSSLGIGSNIDPNKLAELNERQNELTKELKMLKDCRQRLHIHSQVCRMVVAEGIKDFHEQMEILLDKKVQVNEIGPELLKVNRESLNLTLNLEQLEEQSLTAEEQKEMESRVSAKMSNLKSP